MDSSVFAFAEDLRGEGVERVLDRISGYGAAGVTVGAVHHAARDVTPHGLSRLTVRRDGAHFPRPATCSPACGCGRRPDTRTPSTGCARRAASAACGCTAGPCSCATPRSARRTPT
ncbi:hypothetical protein ACFSTC_48245 [Nonomuraea ferruginea]